VHTVLYPCKPRDLGKVLSPQFIQPDGSLFGVLARLDLHYTMSAATTEHLFRDPNAIHQACRMNANLRSHSPTLCPQLSMTIKNPSSMHGRLRLFGLTAHNRCDKSDGCGVRGLPVARTGDNAVIYAYAAS
jgi:hypothetical protein